MIYCIDTSALIDLDREYSLEVFPTLWEKHIVGLIDEGRLIATEEIKTELKKQDDELRKWIMDNCKSMFYPTETPVMGKVGEILSRFPNLINPAKPDKNYADPFVIALALEIPNLFDNISSLDEVMVITHERFTNNLNGPKMPDICRQFDLKVGKLIQLFKSEQWKIGI